MPFIGRAGSNPALGTKRRGPGLFVSTSRVPPRTVGEANCFVAELAATRNPALGTNGRARRSQTCGLFVQYTEATGEGVKPPTYKVGLQSTRLTFFQSLL